MNYSYTFPVHDETSLESGLKLISIPDAEQHGFVIAFQFPFGRFSDPPGREGVCELMIGLLSKGTESFSSEEISEKLENAGATFFSDVGEEHSIIGIRMLAPSLTELLPLFVEMIRGPRFSQEEFKRLRQEMVTGLLAETADTHFLSTRHFYAALAGSAHPAGKFQTVRSLRSITLEDIRRFYDDFVTPSACIAVVGGDWDRKRLLLIAREQFSLLKSRARVLAPVVAPALARGQKTEIRLVHKPELTQTSLAIGHSSPGEKCPEKNALLLANHIFGAGNFSSRLMTRIRTADGKTYGIASQLLTETEFGAFMITTSTQNSQMQGVLTSIIEEYRRFCSDGVTADELEKAKQFAIGNMAFQLEGIGNIVDKMLWLRFYGRPNSYIERFGEIISAIDVAEVNGAIRTYLSPENLIIVAVGKKDEIREQLWTFGEVREFNYRDKL
jgi:zinc protease